MEARPDHLVAIPNQRRSNDERDEARHPSDAQRPRQIEVLDHVSRADRVDDPNHPAPCACQALGHRPPLLKPLRDHTGARLPDHAQPNADADTLAQHKLPQAPGERRGDPPQRPHDASAIHHHPGPKDAQQRVDGRRCHQRSREIRPAHKRIRDVRGTLENVVVQVVVEIDSVRSAVRQKGVSQYTACQHQGSGKPWA